MGESSAIAGIDSTVPHSARVWNYWLGGKDNYAVDREAGDRYRESYPAIVDVARASRRFLSRVVRYLAGEEGVRQFLDVGTGLPTVENTHEVAQRVAPQCRIVYVDNDPLVLAHARALLTSAPEGVTAYVPADLREPDAIIAAAAETLDFTRPVALMLMGILGHIDEHAEACSIVTRLTSALSPGSFFAMYDSVSTGAAHQEANRGYKDSGAVAYNLRAPEEIERYFDGLDLVRPGLVPITRWRREGPEPKLTSLGGVARVRPR